MLRNVHKITSTTSLSLVLWQPLRSLLYGYCQALDTNKNPTPIAKLIPCSFFSYLIIVFFYMSSALAADDSFYIEATPAWNGIYKQNKSTEIMLKLYSSQAGIVKIETGLVSSEVVLQANTPRTVSLPYKPGSLEIESIRTSSGTISHATIEKKLRFDLSKKINVAILSEGLGVQERQDLKLSFSGQEQQLIFVSQDSLPRFNLGYQAIDMLVIHFEAIKQMQEEQSNALRHYISQCGRIVVINFPDKLVKQLLKLSACGDSNIIAVAYVRNVSSQLVKQLNFKPNKLPDLEALSSLVKHNNIDPPYSSLLVFCLGYLFVLLGVFLFSRSVLIMIMVPLIATMATFVVWFAPSQHYFLINWLDVDSAHPVARYSALLNIQGLGKGRENIVMPDDALFSNIDLGLPSQQSVITEKGINTPLNFSLFSSQKWFWQSDIAIEVPLALVNKQQLLQVTNVSSIATKPGFVIWNKQQYTLPALQSGQSWQLDPQSKSVANHAAARLLQQHAQPYVAAVLIPFSANIFTFDIHQQGWLLIHSNLTGHSS